MLGVSWRLTPVQLVASDIARGDHAMVLGPTVQSAVYLTEYQSRGVRLLPYRPNIAHAVAALGDG